MNWRPENWKLPYTPKYRIRINAYEAGADAILKALLKVDTWVQVTRDKRMLVSPAFQVKDWKKYKIVFIPQEE